jgi:hypothetical protein
MASGRAVSSELFLFFKPLVIGKAEARVKA